MEKAMVERVTELQKRLADDPSLMRLAEDLDTFYADVRSSFDLAMRFSGMSSDGVNEILITVDDYVDNHYGY